MAEPLTCESVRKPRTKFLDFDARRDPKTNRWCAKCQKDLKPGLQYHAIHLVGGGVQILHPEDEAIYVDDGGDMYWFEVGNDCARQIGKEWLWPKGYLLPQHDLGDPKKSHGKVTS